jgi:hypothetical protein
MTFIGPLMMYNNFSVTGHSHIHESTHFILFDLLKVHPCFFPRLACGPQDAAPADPPSVGLLIPIVVLDAHACTCL